jgi:hypothetical protein
VGIGRAQSVNQFGAGKMGKYRRARKALRRAKVVWSEFLLLSVFVVLFGAALTVNISDGPMFHMKGAWITHAMQ